MQRINSGSQSLSTNAGEATSLNRSRTNNFQRTGILNGSGSNNLTQTLSAMTRNLRRNNDFTISNANSSYRQFRGNNDLERQILDAVRGLGESRDIQLNFRDALR